MPIPEPIAGSRPAREAVEYSAYPCSPEPAEDRQDEDLISYLLEMIQVEEKRAEFLMRVVIPLGAALVQETDFNHLLERILISAMAMTCADGGALYLQANDQTLRIALFRRDLLKIALGGTSGQAPGFAPISLAGCGGDESHASLAVRAAIRGRSISEFHDSGVPSLAESECAQFDRNIGYHVHSALAIPLRNPDGSIAGIIELTNAHRQGHPEPVPFETAIQRAVEALCLLAAAALQSYLRQEQLKDQVRQLRVQIDDAKKTRQVEAITGSDYFRNLKDRARVLRTAASPAADTESA